jgi:hypothetical protein
MKPRCCQAAALGQPAGQQETTVNTNETTNQLNTSPRVLDKLMAAATELQLCVENYTML